MYNLKDLLKKGMKTEEKNQLSILRFTKKKKKKKPIFGVGIKLKQVVLPWNNSKATQYHPVF